MVVSRFLRRAVLLPLSLAAPRLIGCGGETTSAGGDAGAAARDSATEGAYADASTRDSAAEGADADASTRDSAAAEADVTPCTADPATANHEQGSCDIWLYTFNGTAAGCGLPGGASNLPLATCNQLCPSVPADAGTAGTITYCDVSPALNPPGTTQLECEYGCVKGRRPRGLAACSPRTSGSSIAKFLARMAYFEAASVPAFERLARELSAHGAPQSLSRRALRAARDEVRHARVVTALAERCGGVVARPRVRRGGVRSLEAVALENAVEGCVHETFSAVIVTWQAATARDPHVRSALGRLAVDEVRHAELAWSVMRWAETRLSTAALARVRRARERAARALATRASKDVDPLLVCELGLPPPRVAAAAARELQAEVRLA